LSSNISEYLAWSFRNAVYNPAAIEPEAVDEYVRVFSLPGTIRSCLEDYREGAAVDSPRDLKNWQRAGKLPPRLWTCRANTGVWAAGAASG
jgi:hypothetical protein